MKIYEIETGQKMPINQKKYYPIVKKIETECSDAISSMRKANAFLYRGTRTQLQLFHGRPREDRKSLSSRD